MQPYTFTSLRPQIERAIGEKLLLPAGPQDPEGFTILEGFIDLPIQQSLSADVEQNAPTVTMVGIVGNTTGELHCFPIKALLGREVMGDL